MRRSRAREAMSLPARVLLGVAATFGVLWAAAFDWIVAAAWQRGLGWATALGPTVLLVSVVLTPPFATRPSARWVGCGALLSSVLVVLVPWNDRKRFVHDVFSVRVGMTVDEVEAVMAGYMRGAGAQWAIPDGPDPLVRGPDEPTDEVAAARARVAFHSYRAPEYPTGDERARCTGSMVYRWSTEARFNSDWGLVTFANGKVVKVEFLPD